ncbi:hypothetical protein N579_03750 [Corynebacterium pseudodiphtheriticum 090104]|nr:hypothetical protein N579_03750 [Corynebacterium pseudodiphtheriticum 090104]
MEGDVGDNDGKIFFSAQANGNTIDSLVHFFLLGDELYSVASWAVFPA